jgi:hypothetical protein
VFHLIPRYQQNMVIPTLNRIAVVTLVGTIGVLASAFQAQAGELMTGPAGDVQFNQLINEGLFKETFVTSARVGGASTYELGLLRPDQSVAKSAEYNWVNGQAVDFSLEYDGTNAVYKVGNMTINGTFNGGATDLFLRTRAANNSTSLFSNLTFQDATGSMTPLNLSSTGAGGSDVDYLRIGKVQGAFKLSGKTTLSWTGARPNNSSLIAQIKAGTSKSTPEPATLGALALVAGSAIGLKRRQGK